MRPRPLCPAAEAAIFCQRSSFFWRDLASGRETQRAEGKATIYAAPSSVAFWMTCSSLSDFGKLR